MNGRRGGSQFKRLHIKTRLCGGNYFNSLAMNKFNEENAVRFQLDIGILQTPAYSFHLKISKGKMIKNNLSSFSRYYFFRLPFYYYNIFLNDSYSLKDNFFQEI